MSPRAKWSLYCFPIQGHSVTSFCAVLWEELPMFATNKFTPQSRLFSVFTLLYKPFWNVNQVSPWPFSTLPIFKYFRSSYIWTYFNLLASLNVRVPSWILLCWNLFFWIHRYCWDRTEISWNQLCKAWIVVVIGLHDWMLSGRCEDICGLFLIISAFFSSHYHCLLCSVQS